MSTLVDEVDLAKANALPCLYDHVSIRMLGPNVYTVRDSLTRTYFQVGDQEAYLLEKLKSPLTWDELRKDYSRQFGEKLARDDFDDFCHVLRQRRLMPPEPGDLRPVADDVIDDELDDIAEAPTSRRGTLLFYRIPLADPDRFLERFTKACPFFWTRGFLVLSVAIMLWALIVMVGNRHGFVAAFRSSLQVETAAVIVFAILAATAIHELGHGATCKRYGGSVHESGFLFLFFMPCLYVNVSDAWFIPDRRKRLAITFAGGYCDLCVWALSVLAWRVTTIGTLVNHVAFVLLTTCGTRALMNFNPLLRLDGYYLLSDLVGYSNLYSRGRRYWIGTLNWLLWGARKPDPPPRKWFAFFYGMTTWLFAIAFLNVIGLKLITLAGNQFGVLGLCFSSAMFLYGLRRVFRGFLGSEFITMIRKRFIRTGVWVGGIALLGTLAFVVPVKHYAVGDFEVRAGNHTEIASPLHSFITDVKVQDGQHVEEGAVLLELHAPELATQISGKQFELEQSQAMLEKLQTGARPEEIAVLSDRVQRLTDWCQLGETELATARAALKSQLESLDQRVEQVRLQIQLAEAVLKKSEELRQKGAVAGAQVVQEKAQLAILRSQLSETEALRASREQEGVRTEVAELARRKQQLADADAQLQLLKLGSRAEEIAGERARCQRLSGELDFLRKQREMLVVRAPVSGLVCAPRLREKVGQFAPQGSVLCQIEDPGVPHVEIFVSEDDAASVRTGQTVELKARSLPFETFKGVVSRVAPAAAKPQEAVASQQAFVRQAVVVHCTIEGAENKLKSGMTGFGRIYRGQNKIGSILLAKCYRYIRTEFWW